MGRHWTAGSLRPLPPQGPLSKGGEHFSPAPLRNHLVRNKSHPPSVESAESADIHTAQGHHTWPSEARPGSGGSSHPGHTRSPAKEAGEGGRDPFLGVCWRPRERARPPSAARYLLLCRVLITRDPQEPGLPGPAVLRRNQAPTPPIARRSPAARSPRAPMSEGLIHTVPVQKSATRERE